jgi:mono/diheme cytochrome c family protein
VRPPRDLSDPVVQRSLKDDALVQVVRHGRKGMPALVPRIPASDGPPLAAFVRVLSPGFTLYQRYCASCHGEDGRPDSSLTAEVTTPKVVFDKAYFAQHDPEQLRTTVWHMLSEEKPAMPHYRWILNSAQARSIIEYLKGTE